MNKNNLLLTFIALLSLPMGQICITKFELTDHQITLYWLVLGLFCTFTLVRSRNVMSKSAFLRGTQSLNLILGVFSLTTSTLAGLSYIISTLCS